MFPFMYSHSTEVDHTRTDDSVVTNHKSLPDPKRAAALFVLKTREEGRLTQKTLDQVVQSAASLCEEVTENITGQVGEALKTIGLPEAEQRMVLNKLAGVSCNPFKGLKTEYMQEKYYKDNFIYLVSA